MTKKQTDWRPKPALDKKDGKEAWTHTGAHEINDDEVDGDVSFPEELKEKERQKTTESSE
ncbi:hypothetical protein [Natrinema salifodinae]|uniref:Uncharacterized protein n=1 Tax=Natrinema salifodinae TaxID=1202768 RepID=A0A1I0PM04_9EURY|nr:hypothetical protein [Natrinema salifodinae]SEW14838.1 hypothetical protein SAMN05216285_2664 [Natrinema salifodinae]